VTVDEPQKVAVMQVRARRAGVMERRTRPACAGWLATGAGPSGCGLPA